MAQKRDTPGSPSRQEQWFAEKRRIFEALTEYPRDIARWQEVAVPPESNEDARMLWFSAASWSPHEWRVFAEDDRVCAQRTSANDTNRGERPTFTPDIHLIGSLHPATSFAAVDDGWLIGCNGGEWGGQLYWFSKDGERNYRISNHRIVDFFFLPDGLYAIEGLAHMVMSEGSVIRIARPRPDARWEATTATKLPFAPDAISVRRDGTMLLTLSDSLVSISPDRTVHTLLLSDPPWRHGPLYPNSSLLSTDEQKLYIGMRQFVGEFDLLTKKLRLLIPSDAFLNKLPVSEEQRLLRE